MPVKIAVLIPNFGDGGAQKQCALLINELGKRSDIKLLLIYLHQGVHFDSIKKENISICRIITSSNYSPFNILRIRNEIKIFKPDVIITWLHACDVYGFFLRHIFCGPKWLMTERDSFYPDEIRFMIRNTLGRYADAIVANSSQGSAYWLNQGAKCPIYVVNNIVDPAAHPNISAERGRIAMIGRLENQKNPRAAIEAFLKLASLHSHLEFSVIGDGLLRRPLQELVSNTAFAGRINFLGFRNDIGYQIAKSEIVVSMSHHEGLPNVMLEAVANNRIAVISDIPEHRELFGSEYPFFVADRTDPTIIAEKIVSALHFGDADRHLRHARKKIEHMSSNVVADRYMEIISSMTQGGA